MAVHTFSTQQLLPLSIEEAWNFFSSPLNLATITPANLDFKIISDLKDKKFCRGTQIVYTVKPLFGIPLKWKTLISTVQDYHNFTDVQVGPYITWVHSHIFTQVENGVLMKDVVRYKLPLGIIGEIAHRLFVRKRIEEIFNYRKQVLTKIFIRQNEMVS